MKYYYEPNDKWYNTKQELVDAYNEDFEGTHSTKVTIDNWTEEQWDTIWKPNMKKLEIKTEKATLVVVDLPTCKTHLFYKGYYVMDSSDKGLNDKCRKISQGDTQGFYHIGTDCKYLAKVSEITEEEWKDIVGLLSMKNAVYKDYMNKGCCLGTATQSGLSLLKANGVLLENTFRYPGLIPSSELDIYRKTQEKVWSNPHVFIKID